MKEKNVSIEILRIIACFLVIMAHIQLKPVVAEGVFNIKRICFSSIIGDNVPIFFLITGFYMFKGIEQEEQIFSCFSIKLKKFLVRIWIPAFLVVVMTCVLNPWLRGTIVNYENIQWDWLNNFLFRVSASGSCGHLWYVCTYVRFLIFFPMLAFICQNKPAHNKIRRMYIILSLLNVMVTDMEYLLQNELADYSKIIFDNYFLYLLLGNEIRIFVSQIEKRSDEKKYKFLGIFLGGGMYITGNISRIIFQYIALDYYGTDIKTWYMQLECFPSYISSCGIFLLFYSLKNINWKAKQVWCFLGKYSFYIYLFHMAVIKKLQSLQVQQFFLNLHKGGTGFVNIGFYYLEFGMLIFGISLGVGMMFEKIYNWTTDGVVCIVKKIQGIACRRSRA